MLCISIAHFSKTWGPFGEIFAALEDLNASINRALFATAKVGVVCGVVQ